MQLRVISTLLFNDGFALYRRAKQSWISEVVTNDNGHPFTNYNDALRACDACIDYLNLYGEGREEERIAMCHKLMSDIFYDLYNFEESHAHYVHYLELFTHKQDDKKLLQIKKRIREKHQPYLRILDDIRKHLFVDDNKCDHSEQFDSEECEYKKLLFVLDELEANYKPPFRALIAKLHWFCSEYNAKEMRKCNQMRKTMTDEKEKYEAMSNEVKQLENDLEVLDNLENPEKEDTKSKTNKMKNKAELESKLNEMNLQEINHNIQISGEDGKTFAEKCVTEAQKAYQMDGLYGWSLFNTDTSTDSKQLAVHTIATFTNSIEFEPDQPYYYFIRGSVYYKMERQTEAQKLNDNLLFRVKAVSSKGHANGWDSIKSDTFVRKVIEPLVQLKRTIRMCEKMRITHVYLRKCDDANMSRKEYEIFLRRVDHSVRDTMKRIGTFDEIAGNDGLIDIEELYQAILEILDKDDSSEAMSEANHCHFTRFIPYLEHIQQSQKHLDKHEVDPLWYIHDYNRKEIETQNMTCKALVQHSKDILNTIFESVEFQDSDEGLSEEEWTRFVKLLPRHLVETFDSYTIGKQFAEAPDFNQRVLAQHDITFEKYQIDRIIGYDKFTEIADTLTEIQESNLKITH
eukprot:232587_1